MKENNKKFNSQEIKDEREKTFTLIIQNNTTGQVLVNEKTDIIAGCFRNIEKTTEGFCAMQALILTNCNLKTRLTALKALQNLENEIKEKTLKELGVPAFLKNAAKDIFEDLFEEKKDNE